jgi:hypothetical protein
VTDPSERHEPTTVETAVTTRLYETAPWLVEAVGAAAARITAASTATESAGCAASPDGVPAGARRTSPAADLRADLSAAGTLDKCPAVLTEVVQAAGFDLSFEPTPSPPYVVVSSEGLLLRATIDPGRLVVRLAAFTVRRAPDHPDVWYVPLETVRVDASLTSQ